MSGTDSLHACLIMAFVYAAICMIYNLYFHPLSAFPGPYLARCSLLWRIIHSLRGRFHRVIQDQHKIYGPVLRVSPNELSFASVSSWKDIYGHQQSPRETSVKSEFYDMYGTGFDSLCIGSERDPRKHRQMKTSLTAAFSTKALTEQEHIVSEVVDKFIGRIGDYGRAGMDMTKWFEMVAFDVLGEMAFGQSFGTMETGKPHFWSELIEGHLFFITVADNVRRIPLGPALGRLATPFTGQIRKKHTEYTRRRVASRFASSSGRKDFMSNLVGKVRSGEIAEDEMNAHASTLMIAGGETVATFLAACTYYLLVTSPSNLDSPYSKVRREIRSSFTSFSQIDAQKAQQLPYLQAVIDEALRIYPPGAQGFPRLSPGQTIDGYWVAKGAEIYTSAWTVTHDETNFPDPYTFRPERWIGDDKKQVREASQPFSLGPRGCLGRNFAMMEINLILTKMIWKYDMELLNKSLDWEGSSHMHVMWWKPALMVKFCERTPIPEV